MRHRPATVLTAATLLAGLATASALAAGGSGTVDPPPRIAFLATGQNPADALAAGSIAGQLGAPLFTTPTATLNDDARDGIIAYDPDLVIVLGGPAAVSDAVVSALASATGLSVTTTEGAEEGILRAAGDDRYETARAVAELRDDYPTAFLPVGATALGAIDADTIGGLGPEDFAGSDQACEDGERVVGVDPTGTLECAPVQDVVTVVDDFLPYFGDDVEVNLFDDQTRLNNNGNALALVQLETQLQVGGQGLPNTELVDVTFCVGADAENLELVRFVVTELPGGAFVQSLEVPVGVTADDTCATVAPPSPIIVDESRRLRIRVAVTEMAGTSIEGIVVRTRPTDDAVTG